MEDIQMPPVQSVNLMPNSDKTAYGVEGIETGYRIQIFSWSSMTKSVCKWTVASLDI